MRVSQFTVKVFENSLRYPLTAKAVHRAPSLRRWSTSPRVSETPNRYRLNLNINLGTYVVSTPIIPFYYTSMVGDGKNLPTLKATAGFNGIAVIGESNPTANVQKLAATYQLTLRCRC